jgi:hypothetical protein
VEHIERLTKKEKLQILQDVKDGGWQGCMCDECLIKIAKIVLDYQLRKEKR